MSCGSHQYDGDHPRCQKCGQHRAVETVKGQHVCRPCGRVLHGRPAKKVKEKEVPA